ncbi:MAG: VOC family protein [Actinomycetota bacterium]
MPGSTDSPTVPDGAAVDLPAAPAWRGVNHLALVTPDMDATVRFYAGVLGMPVVATTMAGPMRHYFFEMSPGNTVAFFEVAEAETFAKGAGSPTDRAIQLDHLAFNLPDEAALLQLQARLRAAGSEVTEIVDHGFLRSVYFTDPNGIALEASHWVPEGTAPGTGDPAWFRDPDPVPALTELQAGALASVPRTRLV